MTGITLNDPLLKSVDNMSMTPLHVLCCNPNATLEMIRTLASKYPDTAFVQTKKNGSFPVDFYLVTKIIVKVHLDINNNFVGQYEQRDEIKKWMDRSTHYTIHDLIKYGLRVRMLS